jgi:hypothetical protein
MRWITALVVVVSLSGCTTRIGDLTVGSTKNLPHDFNVIKKDVEGKDCFQMILFIPLGTLNPTYDGAIDAALDSIPEADSLVDATFHQDTLFTLLYNRGCIRVTGDAVRTHQ